MELFNELAKAIKPYPRKVGDFRQAFINVRRNGILYYKVLSDDYNRIFVCHRNLTNGSESTTSAFELETALIETIIKNL